MIYLIVSFLTFLITVITTPYLIQFLTERDLVDKPNVEDRRIHTSSVPRMGGIIIFAAVMVITFLFYRDLSSKIFFVSGALVVFGLGLVDDFKSVKWYVKFAFQSIAAIFLILSLYQNNFTEIKFLGFTLLPWIDYIVLFILIVGLLNSFNFMDGLDGLVTGYSLIVASMCFLLTLNSGNTFLSYLSASIVGTTLGFLKFNANPARMFLGDSGSLTLGFLISSLVIMISGSVSVGAQNQFISYSNTIDLTFVIIALALPLADTIRVIFVRLEKGNNLFLADSSHFHHVLLNKKIRHKTVVLLIHIFSVMFVLLAIYYAKSSQITALIIFIILLDLFFSVQYILGFLIKKEILIAYSKVYNSIPDLIPKIYKNVMLPLVAFSLIVLFIFLIFNQIDKSNYYYNYFILLIIPSLFYSSTQLKRHNYYPELLVLINIVLFFLITGLNGFFYKLYPVPLINQINFNQIFILVLSSTIILFVLFKERVANIRLQFLTGSDLIISVLILSIYVAVQFINLPDSYMISDTLFRSYLVYLFYKILVVTLPKIHFPLYYVSFFIAVIAVLISII